MTGRSPLYDAAAEEAVLGAALLSQVAVETMLSTLVASDFGSPNRAAIFGAIGELYRRGEVVNPLSVQAALTRAGTAWDTASGDLIALQANAPGTSAAIVTTHGRLMTEHSLRRRLVTSATALSENAYDPTKDPGDVLDEHRASLTDIDSPVLFRSPGDIDIAEFIRQEDDSAATVVPNLLVEDDRAIIVGLEGSGKTELLRQIAFCVSRGVHPFAFTPIPPLPTLLVDLENPKALVRRRLKYLDSLMRTGQETARGMLWHRPGGIDLRRRADRLELEDVIRRNRPKLVCLLPVYKMYTKKANESEEAVCSELQAILDDLRVRYAFALVLEHHAPQGNNGTRELRPFGSSLWLRWPEYGLRLTPDSERPREVLHVGRWRGDRSQARWPDELHRGRAWPWQGVWSKTAESEDAW